ncbi:hypothetical protein D3C81_1150100 [compost metagenome]
MLGSWITCAQTGSAGTKNQVLFPVFLGHAGLGEHAPGLGNAHIVHRLRIAADQIVPGQQILAFGH